MSEPAVDGPATPARSLDDLLADCVHCGFCLPACPTYRSWGRETDSPRGRIDLIKGAHEGDISLSGPVVEHLDACLGCMACVPACPSGVRYDLLIETMRAKIEREYERDGGDAAFRRFVFSVFPYPKKLARLAPLLFLFRKSGVQRLVRKSRVLARLNERLAQLDRLVPEISFAELRMKTPGITPAVGLRRGRVALVAGCVQRVFFPNVNAATARVLSREGFEVIVRGSAGCCGALSLHAGRAEEAERFATELRAALTPRKAEPIDAIVVNAAGCGSALKERGEAFFGAPVYDVHEFLAAQEPAAARGPLPLRVAYQDACHLGNAQGIREQPRALLRSIPKLELVEVPEQDQCCGSAGVYNLLQPESAREIGLRKIENVLAAKAQVLASANPGCSLQIRSLLAERGVELTCVHPIELLDASLLNAPKV